MDSIDTKECPILIQARTLRKFCNIISICLTEFPQEIADHFVFRLNRELIKEFPIENPMCPLTKGECK